RPGWPSVCAVQVPHHARAGRWGRFAARCATPDLAGRRAAAREPRRTATVVKCPARRYAPRRTAPAADGVPSAVFRAPGAAARGAAGTNGLGAGEWAQFDILARALRAGCLVR